MSTTSKLNKYDTYKNSGIEWIGDIPSHWKIDKFSRIFNKITDYVASGSFADIDANVQYLDEPDFAMLVRTADLSGTKDKRVYIDEHAYNYLSNSNLFGGELILSNIGSVGNVYIYEPMYKYSSLAPNAIMLDGSKSNRFIYYWLINPLVNDELKKIGCHAIQLKFNKTQLRQFKAVCPPKSEQQQIADYLDRKCEKIDKVVETQKNIIEKLKEYKQSVIMEAVTKGLDKSAPLKDSGIEWIGEIPENWEVYKLKHCVIFNPTYSENLAKNTPVSFAPMECLTNCILDCKETTVEKVSDSYTYFAEEDVIMAKVTPCFENGNIAIAKNLLNKVGFGTSELYVFRAKNINNKFLLYFLQNRKFKDLAISTMYGTGGLKRISTNFVKNYKFGLPKANEQMEITDYLDKKCSEIDSAISDKEQLIEKLTEYKKSLIYECVTGKRKIVA